MNSDSSSKTGVVINSDFKDYYDSEFVAQIRNKKQSYVYNRLKSNSKHRAEDLKYLKANNIPTIEIKPVVSFQLLEPSIKILVYTQPTEHNGMGKLILENREAQDLYPNLPGRLWVPNSETGGFTLKCLQIGERRFKIILKDSEHSKKSDRLSDNQIVSIEEIDRQYSVWNRTPIYQIDYLPTSNGLLAIDYNQVERLDKLKIDSVMSAKEVYQEIIKSLNRA